jgi:protein-disulfide isomerase
VKASSEVKLFGCILIVAIALAGVALYPVLSQRQIKLVPPPPPAPSKITREKLIPAGSHIRGNPDAPVSFVIFSDFQCNSCGVTAPLVEKFIKPSEQNTVNVVYHHYKAATHHQFSELLAYASEAAAKQGKFWEMHDLLFKNQPDIVSGDADISSVRKQVVALAEKLKLDIPKFRADLEGEEVRKIYLADNELAIEADATGTPWMYVAPKDGKVMMIPDGSFTEAVKYLQSKKYIPK